MKSYQKWIVAGLVLCSCSALGVAKTTAITESAKVEPTILYSQMALSAEVAPAEKKGWYRLTLHNVNKNTLWFTDRPVRKSGTLTNPEFLKDWNAVKADSFAQDNPNASLVAFFDKDEKQKEQVFVIRLANPVYDVEAKTMQYQVQFVSKNGQGLLKNQPLYDVALFIDSNPPCGWCI